MTIATMTRVRCHHSEADSLQGISMSGESGESRLNGPPAELANRAGLVVRSWMLVVTGLAIGVGFVATVSAASAQTGKKPAASKPKSHDNEKENREGLAPKAVKGKKL